jgi:tetratricopeptide (TPR) repeat protein
VGGSGRRAALDALGVIRIAQGDLAGARPLLEDALVAVEEGTIWTPYQLVQLALLERNEGNVSAARSHLEEALAFARGHEEDGYVALALNSLGDLDRLEGEYDRAEDRYEEALARVTHIGITMARPGMIHNLAHVAHARGDDTKARELFREALDLFEEMGDRRGMAECVAGLACLHAGSDPREMARLFGAASAAVREMGVALSGSNQADYDRAIAEARSHLGAEFDEAVREGESISLAEAVRTVRDTWT